MVFAGFVAVFELGFAEFTPAFAPCNKAVNTKVQTAKVETVDTP